MIMENSATAAALNLTRLMGESTMMSSTSESTSPSTTVASVISTIATNATHMLLNASSTSDYDMSSHMDPTVEYRSFGSSSDCWHVADLTAFRIPELRSLPTTMIVLLSIALLVTFWAVVKFVQALWTYFICYLLGFGAKWEPGPDSWAIVTGSTDGIGLAYAKAMARKGYCLLLLSRNQQKLDKVKAEILNEYPNCPTVKVMSVDFTQEAIYKTIQDEIHALGGKVHVLINNVGMAYKYPEYFTKIPNSEKFISDILNCNILSVTRMTHIVLPLMEARRSGIIINISSYSALFPTPLLAMYSASKIYMDYFSRALHAEYRERGIIVQSVLPYYVSTNMIRNPGISFMIPSPDQFVNSALKTVGVEVRTYGYFAHNILAFFQSFIVKFVIGNNLNTKIAFFRMKRFRKGCYKRKGLKHNV